MRMDPTIKRREKPKAIGQGWRVGLGVASLVVAVVILLMSLWEAFGGLGRVQVVSLPGFHRLTLKEPGLYGGFYQHRGDGPIPSDALSKMNVRILSKDDFSEVPVLMNSAGAVVERMGIRGMPLFNFVIQEPGHYTMSAAYVGVENGPDVEVTIFPQTVQNARTTLIVGILFFLLFIAIGVVFLRRPAGTAPARS